MAQIYYESDADPAVLHEQTIAVIGYGNQGRAHALNLRDSGLKVIVGARSGGAATHQAKSDGFNTHAIGEAALLADVLAIMLPDEYVPQIFEKEIEKKFETSKTFVFAHGFVVTNKTIKLPENADVLLVAPTGPGRQVRSLFLEGKGLPALIAVEQDVSKIAWQKKRWPTHTGSVAQEPARLKLPFKKKLLPISFVNRLYYVAACRN